MSILNYTMEICIYRGLGIPYVVINFHNENSIWDIQYSTYSYSKLSAIFGMTASTTWHVNIWSCWLLYVKEGLDPFCIVTYSIRWVKTWIYSNKWKITITISVHFKCICLKLSCWKLQMIKHNSKYVLIAKKVLSKYSSKHKNINWNNWRLPCWI